MISTHVLDITKGRPVPGIPVDLYREGVLIASAVTNADGRISEPDFPTFGEVTESGTYELVFKVGAYLQNEFLNEIPVRFVISDAAAKYHVPLLLAGHGYSTYRGS